MRVIVMWLIVIWSIVCQINVMALRFLNAGTSNNKYGLLISDGYAINVIGCDFSSISIGVEIGTGQNISIKGCYFEANRSQAIRG